MPTTDDHRSELLRSIRLSPIASIVTDPKLDENPIIAANRHFEQLSGYSEEELIGRNCRILAGLDTQPAGSQALRQAVESATPTVVELINYRKDGSTFLNAVMIAPVFDDQGKLNYFLGTQMEVSRDNSVRACSTAAERIHGLTARQQAVLRLMARGFRNRVIGEKLGLTEKTIKMHRTARPPRQRSSPPGRDRPGLGGAQRHRARSRQRREAQAHTHPSSRATAPRARSR